MQEGFGRLWRGTGASLALAMPSVSSLSCLEFSLYALWFALEADTVHFGSPSCIFYLHLTFSQILMVLCVYPSNRLESICLVMIFSATIWRSLQLRILQI